MRTSELEEEYLYQIKLAGLPEPVREYLGVPDRRFRIDFAWPDRIPQIAVEIHGGIWSGGRHVRGKGFEKDCEKRTLLNLGGWMLLEFTARDVKGGDALLNTDRAIMGSRFNESFDSTRTRTAKKRRSKKSTRRPA